MKVSLKTLTEPKTPINAAEIKKSFASMCDEAQSCMAETATHDDLNCLAESLYYSIERMYSMIHEVYDRMYEAESNTWRMFDNHLKGHLPPINSVEQMQRAIEGLGLSKEIDVQKRVIYASNGKQDKLVLEISKKAE